jgi:hypothetical protein
MWHVRGKKEIHNIQVFFVEKPKEREHLEHIGVNENIILKWILSEIGRKGID